MAQDEAQLQLVACKAHNLPGNDHALAVGKGVDRFICGEFDRVVANGGWRDDDQAGLTTADRQGNLGAFGLY